MPEVEGKVIRTDSRNETYNFPRNQILSPVIEPGKMLSENSLSPQVGVDCVLIGDTLTRLVGEGYIVVYPQRGAVAAMIDPGRTRQSVHTHIALEQVATEEIYRQGLVPKQREVLGQTLIKQKEITGDNRMLELLAAGEYLCYLLSAFCGKEHIWDYFRTMNCDLIRTNCLQYSTPNFKVYMSSLTRWEHTQVGGRLLVDNTTRGDTKATSLTCSDYFSTILWSMDVPRGTYLQLSPR